MGSLDLIKGRGGALLREKIVASVSDRLVIVVDESKIVERLGRSALPAEVVPFGWEATARKLRDVGATPSLRRGPDGEPFLTDGGHYILDCILNGSLSPALLEKAFDSMVGLVEHGFFLGMASQVFVGGAHGLRELSR
jgi:ribose 5-phosphate isomerase A